MPQDTAAPEAPENGTEAGKTFTQDEVNHLVGQARQDERRKAQSKYADYDEMKAAAGKSKTLEERFAEVEARAAAAEAKALRSDIAAKHGISPEDRDLFLTGADEDTLTAQAQRLAARETDRKNHSNVVPKEGATPRPADSEERELVRSLFNRA